MPSVLWAGERGKGRVRVKFQARVDDLEYQLECGLPVPGLTAFNLDPEVKVERVSYCQNGKKVALLERKLKSVQARDLKGKRLEFQLFADSNESVLSELREPHRFPELSALRQSILLWRFYHQFRTDFASPLRQPQPLFRTPVLSHDGHDVAAALVTIQEVGDREALSQLLDAAFPGSHLNIKQESGRLSLGMFMPGFQRAFEAHELSDGTLHYLCLLAALLSPRPPHLMALNEPETSIHPTLYKPLAMLIAEASQSTQMWITTHSQELADYILEYTGASPIELEKVEGETRIVGQKLSDDDDDEDVDDG